MNARRHGTIVASLVGIALVCGVAGGAVGYRMGRQAMKQRADPETWHEQATRRFDELVRPTAEQTKRLDVHLTAALSELRGIRQDAIARSTLVIEKLVTAVEAELTPEQKASFQQLKPRREDMNLDVLQLERSGKK